jgi:hypothetical protein
MEESTRKDFYLLKLKNHSFPCVLAWYGAFSPLSEAVLLSETEQSAFSPKIGKSSLRNAISETQFAKFLHVSTGKNTRRTAHHQVEITGCATRAKLRTVLRLQ